MYKGERRKTYTMKLVENEWLVGKRLHRNFFFLLSLIYLFRIHFTFPPKYFHPGYHTYILPCNKFLFVLFSSLGSMFISSQQPQN